MGLFLSKNNRDVKKLMNKVHEIEQLDESMQALSDAALRAKTQEFKKRLANGETTDDLLVEAFAVVREAADRVLHMKHYPVQLAGGIALHQGNIAELKTGEGKTLVSTAPAYLNALEGKGVHIVTVNDYLAKRDAEWMGAVHRFLGLSVGVVLNNYGNFRRKNAYNCDITYITNNELGFDYLRDNMVIFKEEKVQRGLHYAIIDEADSVLIDEARTPLIISGEGIKSTHLYKLADVFAKQCKRGSSDGELSKVDAIMGIDIEEDGDFLVNEKDNHIMLTAEGVKKAEKFFHIDNLSDPQNLEIQHHITLALRAHNLMHRDQDYVVKDDEVLIVDEFTGRLMPGRRYNDGLHQAIEAKEGVKIQKESNTLATITFQNFFNKYKKKAGMTGTAKTEEKEFRDIYNMNVVVIPTNKPMIRNDLDDSIYMSKKEKMNAVVQEILHCHEKGQPVLVGTINIDTSEELSEMLQKKNIPHHVLNAKFHEQEAEIVSHAGEKGAVTIATNMAGRGTDIKLGDGVAELGGLKIIGTERHESRRIDNQLRGRSGRQGDPGESKFYLSLEDDLMRLFGSERMMSIYRSLNIPEGEELQHKTLTKQIEKAQKKIENNNFGIRKNLMDYDKVNNDQREIIYKERNRVLNNEDMHEVVYKMIRDCVEDDVKIATEDKPVSEWKADEILKYVREDIPVRGLAILPKERENDDREGTIERIVQKAMKIYHAKEEEFDALAHLNIAPESLEELDEIETSILENGIREAERVVILKVIDSKWMNHIDDMEQLRQSIGLQSYAGKDPVVQYNFFGYQMFDEMAKAIRHDTVSTLMYMEARVTPVRQQVMKEVTPQVEVVPATPPKVVKSPANTPSPKKKKIGRNDPCPCGSGKKYKKCCGKNIS